MEWALIFVSGLLGSSHCVGMCGPIVVTIGSAAPSWRANMGRQLLFSCGRLFTYSFLGAAAGYLAWRSTTVWGGLRYAQCLLTIVAGVLLIYQGLTTGGILRWREPSAGAGCGIAGRLFSDLLIGPGQTRPFLAGLFTGFLPCGLVYGFLALAASTTQPATGAAVMAVFGAGTVPLMAATGCAGSMLSPLFRRQILQAAAWCVVFTGVLTVARGATFLLTSRPPGHNHTASGSHTFGSFFDTNNERRR